MKRNLCFTLLIVLLSVIGCDGTADRNTVGVVAPMTGNLAFLGEEEVRGIRLALRSEKNFTYKVEDSGLASFDANVAAKRLIDVQSADVLWASTSRVSRAVKDVASNRTIPFVAFTADPTIEDSSEGTIRYYLDTRQEVSQLRSLAVHAIREGGRVGVMYLEIPPIERAVNEILKGSLDTENSVYVSYSSDTREFRPLISRLKRQAVDLIIVLEYGFTHALVLDALDDLYDDGLHPQIAGGMGFIWNVQNEQISTERLEDIVVAAPQFLVNKPPAYQDFVTKYRGKFGGSPTFDAVLAFQSIKHVLAAQDTTKPGVELPEPDASFNGPAGRTVLDKEGGLIMPMTLSIIKDGRFEEYQELAEDEQIATPN